MSAFRIAVAAFIGSCVLPLAAQIPVDPAKDQQPASAGDTKTTGPPQNNPPMGLPAPADPAKPNPKAGNGPAIGETPTGAKDSKSPDAEDESKTPADGPELSPEQKASEEYSGPAVLSRGITASQMMNERNVKFTPSVGIEGVVNSGLTSISLDANGKPRNNVEPGLQLVYGIAGTKLLKKDRYSLTFGGSLYHYPSQSSYDGTDNHLNFDWQHEMSKRLSFGLKESIQEFNQNNLLTSGIASVDTSASSLLNATPTTEAFDGMVFSLTTQGAITYRFDARLSLSFTGAGFMTRRRSTALYGDTGSQAGADLQYRLTRRMTIGTTYSFTNFDFTGLYGDTQLHTVGGTFSYAFNRNTEFSSRVGGSRLETTSLSTLTLDPVLAAILGTTEVLQAAHKVGYLPDITLQFRRQISNFSISAAYSRGVTPGNGLILTSIYENGSLGVNYKASRVWNLAASTGYDGLSGTTSTQRYSSIFYNSSIYRKLGRQLEWHFRADYHHYTYDNTGLLHNMYIVSSGIVWTPGDILNRLW